MSLSSNVREYNELLWKIQDQNKPVTAILLPSDELLGEIDLEGRTAILPVLDPTDPTFLSVQHDHYAETVYFKCARYFDNTDLATTVCIIQYVNANGKQGIYRVPFYDVVTYRDDNIMLVPWCIDGLVTEAMGEIQFAIRFYLIDPESIAVLADGTHDVDRMRYLYNLNTLPQTAKVKYGLDALSTNEETDVPPSVVEYLLQRVQDLEDNTDLWWTDMF